MCPSKTDLPFFFRIRNVPARECILFFNAFWWTGIARILIVFIPFITVLISAGNTYE